MADVEQALFTRLSGFAGLTALVSTRVFPVTLPQQVTYPAVVMQKVSAVRHPAFNTDSGVTSARFQVSAFGKTYSATKAVIDQVRAALQRFRGTVSTVVIQDIMVDGEIHLYEPTNKTHQVSMDFLIHHRE